MKKYSEQKVSTFRERFCELCDESSKNDTALADALHVSKQTISAWKTGKRSPKQPTIVAIANEFKVNISWLMGFDVQKNVYILPSSKNPISDVPKNDEVRLLIRGLNQLSPEQLEQATNVMKAMFPKYADFFEKGKTTNDR